MWESRLAENVLKMADKQGQDLEVLLLSEHERSLLDKMERPIFEKYSARKVLCGRDDCVKKLLFFEENGIEHHFRIAHKSSYTASDRESSLRICRKILEDETRKCFEILGVLLELRVANPTHVLEPGDEADLHT
jgi:hypothetical protein